MITGTESQGSSSESAQGEQAPEALEGQAQQGIEPEPQEDPKDLDFARRFNALSRREKQIIERESQVKSEYQQMEEYKKDKAMLSENPLAFIKKHGFNLKDLADLEIDGQLSEETKTEKMERQLKEMEAKLEEKEQNAAKQAEEEKNNQLINGLKKSIREHVESDLDGYELVNHYQQFDMVMNVMENYYEEHKEVLAIDKAAKEVENYLEAEIEKAASTKKFKSKFGIAPEEKEAAFEGVEDTPPNLTNKVASSYTQTDQTKTYLSDDESKAAAAAMLRKHFRGER